jgi:hypothetical protein
MPWFVSRSYSLAGLKTVLTTVMVGAMVTQPSISLAQTKSSTVLCKGFLPENNLRIPVPAKRPLTLGFDSSVSPNITGITEHQFNVILDRIENLYSDEVKRSGGSLQIKRRWQDPMVNAKAERDENNLILSMWGGAARHPTMTYEGFALVACHELGHHMGGAPKGNDNFGEKSWATNEGGADYFATLKCLRRFFADDDNVGIIANAKIDLFARTQCETQFSTRSEQALCLRSAMATASVAQLFKAIYKDKKDPSFATNDPTVASEMIDGHPGTQCRMDTLFNGALCRIDQDVPLSNADYHQGSCYQPQDAIGYRPACWFHP